MIMGLLVVYSCWVWPTLILLGEPEKKKNKTKQNKTKKAKQNSKSHLSLPRKLPPFRPLQPAQNLVVFREEDMDIFWNYTIFALTSLL